MLQKQKVKKKKSTILGKERQNEEGKNQGPVPALSWPHWGWNSIEKDASYPSVH